MLYANLKLNRAYLEQKYLTLPKGDTVGFGNAVILLGPSFEDDCALLSDNFIRYRESMYKKFYTDTTFREKIGKERISEILGTPMTKYFKDLAIPGIVQVQQTQKVSALAKNPNVIVSMGKWNQFFFANRYTVSPIKMVSDYFKFISERISAKSFPGYKRTIFIPLDKWKTITKGVIKFSSKTLNDPISLIMYAIYKDPNVLVSLGNDTEIVFCDTKTGYMFKSSIDSFLMTEGYNTIKRLITRDYTQVIDETGDESDEKDIAKAVPSAINPDKTNIPNTISNPSNPTDNRAEFIKAKVKSNIMETIRSSKDITPSSNKIIFDEEETDLDSDIDEEDVDVAINQAIDENMDVFDSDTTNDEAIDAIEDKVKVKLSKPKYMPERTPEEEKKYLQLASQQKKAISTVNFDDVQSKIIDESSYEDVITTDNPDISHTKFKNFDKSYNEKKLQPDIDSMVSAVSKAEYPLFVVSKTVKDTSDQLNLKETYTYVFKDEMDNEFVVNIDVPKIIDDKYIYIGGNKKIILKQRIMKPLTKIKPDQVVLSTAYKKIFMTRTTGNVDRNSTAIKKFLMKNADKFSVKFGNAAVKNAGLLTDLDFDFIGRNITEFKYGDTTFMFDINECIKFLESVGITSIDNVQNKAMLVGYRKNVSNNKTSYSPLFVYHEDGQRVTELIYETLSDDDKKAVNKIPIPKKSMYTKAKLMSQEIPLILFMLFCDGFSRVMQKANIQYWIHENKDDMANINEAKSGIIELVDGFISYDRYPVENSLLMAGLDTLPMNLYKLEDLETKDMCIELLAMFYSQSNITYALDQFKDFMIDDISKEVLMDFNMPTDLIELLAYANRWLATNEYKPVYHSDNLRVRSNECIPVYVYQQVTNAYINYRRKMYTGKPGEFYVRQDAALKEMVSDRLCEGASVLNPVLELEKNRAVTFKGPNGINLDKAFNMKERAFDSSMVGLTGISTSPDAGCGIVRQLTLEPMITSTRGYIQNTKPEDVDKLTSANLFTPAELLSPPGVRRDDPQRTAMAYKQSKYMVIPEDSSPVLIGNKVEDAITEHLSRDFVFAAKQNGKVVERTKDMVVVQYDDKSYDSYDLSPTYKNNAAGGFFIEANFDCPFGVGDTFKAGETIAYNNSAFKKKNNLTKVASMNIGVLTKTAVIANYDIFEDSVPITKQLSERLATDVVMQKEITLYKDAYVQSICKVGDHLSVGDPFIVYDNSMDDPSIDAFLQSIRDKSLADEWISRNIKRAASHYTGEIVDIKIYCTVPTSALSDTLRPIVEEYYAKLKKHQKILKNYQNPGDSKYYQCGQHITEYPEKIQAKFNKVKGSDVGNGVLIEFYLKYKDIAKKGDKVTGYTALKGIVSNVIEEGQEPYSDFRPNEEVSTFLAPSSIIARKTPSILLTMFGNKVLIELKRKMESIYYEKDFKDTY